MTVAALCLIVWAAEVCRQPIAVMGCSVPYRQEPYCAKNVDGPLDIFVVIVFAGVGFDA